MTVRWSLFVVGLCLLLVCSLGNPFLLKDSVAPYPVFFAAVGMSVLGFLSYAIGVRSFLRDYERAEVRLVYFPIAAAALLGFLAPIVILLLLWLMKRLGAL